MVADTVFELDSMEHQALIIGSLRSVGLDWRLKDTYVDASWSSEAGGTAPNVGDCNDSDANIHPGAPDAAYDGIDGDCDGWNDFDQDRDGYVDQGFPGQAGGTSPNTVFPA